MRRIGLVLILTCSLLSGTSVLAAPCWLSPVDVRVVDPFREPACRWCPGNRGLEYGTRGGEALRAVASGTVTFSGTIAGRRYLVVRHADGLRVTYGNLADTRFQAGAVVAAGVIVGHAANAFHFGVREGDRYVDPAQFIGTLVGVPRLIPTDGGAAPPAGPPRLACAPTSVGNRPTTR